MKKNLLNFLIILFISILITYIFLNRVLVTDTAIESVYIWLTKVFPTLFIMFILSDFLIKYNFAYYFNKVIGHALNKLFKLSDNAMMCFILSIISGSPANAYIINDLYSTEKICKKEANHLLTFTYFANPLFLYNILMIMFNNNTVVFKIIFSVYLSNFLLAFAIKNNYTIIKKALASTPHDTFGVFLVNSLKKSINNIILILGSITFFMILSKIITLQIDNIYLKSIITGIFEITSGIEMLSSLNIGFEIKKILVTIIISFGGLSIHSQVYSMIYNSKLSYLSFLKGRLISSLLSFLIIIII